MRRPRTSLSVLLIAVAAPAAAASVNCFQERGDRPAPDVDRAKFTIRLLPNNAQKDLDFALTLLNQGHVAEALAALQPFVSHHANRLIPVQYAPDGALKVARESDLWLGVGYFLQKYFEQLPAEMTEQVEKLDGPAAKLKLDAALAARSIEGLLKVHREAPWTRAGGAAVAAAAELLLERGETASALAYYKRLLSYKNYKNDAEIIARAAALETALGGVARIPRELGTEFADLGGGRVALKNISQSKERLPSVEPPQFFSNNTESLPPDPGAIADQNPWHNMLTEEPQLRARDDRPIYAVISDDTVYASNGWSLAAFDLVTGKPRWNDPGMAKRWDKVDFEDRSKFQGSENELMAFAPAVANNIVVAPLLVPLKHGESYTFNGTMQVKARLLHRKLHAFDIKTGERIWDHWRPDDARFSTDILDQYICSGPPVIAGDLVIAPLYTMPDDATVEFHVGAFSLKTGDLVWETTLVTGTTPINMFGRSMKEFCSSPAAVDRDRIYISSDLGACASIEVDTGQIVWLHRYETIPIPRSAGYHNYEQPERQVDWAVGPPALSDTTVFFAPTDSNFLIAVDRETGRRVSQLRASMPVPERGRNGAKVRHLLGVLNNIIYLSGNVVVALDAPSLDSPVFRTRATFPSEMNAGMRGGDSAPRPALTDKSVLVPQASGEIIVLDNIELKRTQQISYVTDKKLRDYPGNITTGNGVVVVVRNPHIIGHSNLQTLVENSRRALAAKPEDAMLKERLGRCLRMRGDMEAKKRNFGAAIQDLTEAESILSQIPGTTDLITTILLALGSAHEGRGETVEAAKAYKRAFDQARDEILRIEAGIALELQLPRSAAAERLKLLKSLETGASAARGYTSTYGEIPYALYFILRRAEILAPVDGNGAFINKDPAAAALAVAAWQEALRTFPAEFLTKQKMTAAQFAETRIAAAIAEFGADCYQTVETEARAHYASLSPKAGPEEYTDIIQHYPNSSVVVEAGCARLDALIRMSRSTEVMEAAATLLSKSPKEPVRARIYKSCAEALRSLGNPWLASIFDARAAGNAPPGINITNTAKGPVTPLRASTSADSADFLDLARPALDDGSGGDVIFAFSNSRVVALNAGKTAGTGDDPARETLFEVTLPRDVLESSFDSANDSIQFPFITILNGVVTIAHRKQIRGYKINPVTPQFNILLDGVIENIVATSGAIILTVRGDDDSVEQAICMDAVSGAILWKQTLERDFAPYIPVADSARVLLLPCGDSQSRKLYHFDLITGEKLPAFELPREVLDLLGTYPGKISRLEQQQLAIKGRNNSVILEERNREYSDLHKIYNSQLLIVRTGTKSSLLSLQIKDGQTAWKLAPNEQQRFHSILLGDNEIYILVTPSETIRRVADAEFWAVNPANGETRVLAKLPPNARIAGIRGYDSSVRWRLPMVITYSDEPVKKNTNNRSTRIDGIELASGKNWTRSIPVLVDSSNAPAAPAIGESLVAIAYTIPSMNTQYEMRIFRRDTGEYAVDRTFELFGRPLGLVATSASFAVLAGQPRSSVRMHTIQNHTIPKEKK